MAGHRKYMLNESFFSAPTPENSYVMGFIAADGYVTRTPRNGGVLSISLAIKDMDFLYKIRFLLGSTHPIKIKDRYNACRLDIGSRKLVDRLCELGICSRKSLTLEWPDFANEYPSHFVRGYFDGDGYARIQTSQYGSFLQLSMLGTKNFLEKAKQIYTVTTNATCGIIYKAGNQYNLSYGGSDCPVQFGKWMYEKHTNMFCLTRKYDIYNKYVTELYIPHAERRVSINNNMSLSLYKVTNREEVIQMMNRYLEVQNYAEVAREFNLSYGTVRHNIIQQIKRERGE